jgi:hypothetical protein
MKPFARLTTGVAVAAFAAVLDLCFCAACLADTVYMKNGDRMEGRIIAETDTQVTLDMGVAQMVLDRSRIDKIVKGEVTQPAPTEKTGKPAPKKTQQATGAAAPAKTPPKKPMPPLTGWDKIRFGAKLADVAKLYLPAPKVGAKPPGSPAAPAAAEVKSPLLLTAPAVGVKYAVVKALSDGRVFSIMVVLESGDETAVVAKLKEKYGDPAEADKKGAKEYTWGDPKKKSISARKLISDDLEDMSSLRTSLETCLGSMALTYADNELSAPPL